MVAMEMYRHVLLDQPGEVPCGCGRPAGGHGGAALAYRHIVGTQAVHKSPTGHGQYALKITRLRSPSSTEKRRCTRISHPG